MEGEGKLKTVKVPFDFQKTLKLDKKWLDNLDIFRTPASGFEARQHGFIFKGTTDCTALRSRDGSDVH